MSRFSEEVGSVVVPRTTASLAAAGITGHMTEGPRWRRIARGLFVPESVRITTTQRVVEAAAVMGPRGVLGGWAAAFVHGVDQLDGLNDFSLKPMAVPILMPDHIHRASTPAFDYRQDDLAPTEIAVRNGVRVTTPARTVLDLMTWAPDVTEAVVGLDAALAAGLVSLEDMTKALPTYACHRGSRLAAAALERGAVGVKSTWESRLRVMCVHELGWPELLVNQPVYDFGGRFLGIPDLLDEEAGVALEYDGGQWNKESGPNGHRDREQHRKDNVREEGLERANLIVIRVEKADMTRHRSQLRLRLQTGRRDGLRRDRTRDRWTLARRIA